ncbi:FAD:protein FMN transferase [Agromyces tardus]|uniref:FAD:protein FMN transferase n=2 Tax=Agromyces tardus TaxID=2583849 RepID=A0A3M8A221_9MICO|nr:FAD:protein FMN transferase [Agromyces tardus]
MGTVVSLRLEGTRDAMATDAAAASLEAESPTTAAAVAAVGEVFARWEAHCSLYDPASELSRIGRGELGLVDAGEEVRGAYELALHWRARTGGSFTPHRGDGLIDLNGVVKALAIAESGAALDGLGVTRWGIDAGGDVLVGGAAAEGQAWRIGIVDPADRGALLGAIDLAGVGGRMAVATSGSAERGDHIWTQPGAGPAAFVQVSVAAGDILTADVLATAIVAGGRAALDEYTERFPIDVLAVLGDGSLLATPGWPRADAVTQPSAARDAAAAR